MEYYAINTDPYLQHHGVKGQRWGVRRYQNADGSYTAAGKKKYLNDDGTLNAKGRKFEMKQTMKEERRINSALTDVYAHAKFNRKTREYEVDTKKLQEAVNKAGEFAKKHGDYNLVDDYKHITRAYYDGYTYWEQSMNGYGLEARKGTPTYEYGKKQTRKTLAISGALLVTAFASAVAAVELIPDGR